jgi:hypothetical protein
MLSSFGSLRHFVLRLRARLSPETWNLVAAFCILLVVSNIPLDANNPKVSRCAAVTLVMSYLWMSAPIPIGCTALLPLPLFPMLGISPAKSVAVSYFNDTMWVFIGSFIVALAVEKSGLHRRIALRALTIVGTRPVMVLAAFMGVTALLSMVLSNTACAIMMVPIAGAMFEAIDNISGASSPGLKKALYLGIAYASSTGGLTTLTGLLPFRISLNPRFLTQLCRHWPQPHYGRSADHDVSQGAAHILHAMVLVRPPPHHCGGPCDSLSMFAGPIGLVMLLGEWALLYVAWVHPWAWRQPQQVLCARADDVSDSSAAEGDAGRIELGLLSRDKHIASDDHFDYDAAENSRAVAGAVNDGPVAHAAQAAAIRALYDEMGPVTRTQKVNYTYQLTDPDPPPSTPRCPSLHRLLSDSSARISLSLINKHGFVRRP